MKLTKEMRKAFQTPQAKSIVPKLNQLQKRPGLTAGVASDLKANMKNTTEQIRRPKVNGGRRI